MNKHKYQVGDLLEAKSDTGFYYGGNGQYMKVSKNDIFIVLEIKEEEDEEYMNIWDIQKGLFAYDFGISDPRFNKVYI
jgi:hypothetical protein